MQTRKSWTAIFAVLLFMLCAATTGHAASATQGYWQDAPARPLPPGVARPDQYRSLDLDVLGLKRAVAQGETRLALPAPDGGFIEVTLEDSGVMPPELAARHPEIRSFRGQDSDGTRVRVDISPLGVNAMVFAKAGIWLVRPVQFGDGGDYISFKRTDVASQREPFDCDVHDFDAAHAYSPDEIATTTGTTKRNYRAAVAANRFYVQALAGANPPTVAIGLAGVVTAMNRVNEVYENDLSIHMSLVPNNDLIIYPDAATDPYSNGTGALNQNTGNLNAVIGAANYDIGHVFTTGSGGVAGLGVVCTANKGRGTTGLSNPAELVSDIFYIDYVAHEMGHQFGANHTFNNSCGGNRSAGSAYEPGSGSTIMAYAGICSPNLQSSSDAYFHARSLLEIGNFTNGTGGSCSANTPNHAAPVLGPLSPYTIPARTPFALTGSATGGLGNPLTFAWEQYDLGPATVNINVDPGNGPIIRSFMPTESPVRTVPRFPNLLAGTSNVGEILPTTNRNLTFRLTVRDNVPGGGTSESSDMVLTVNNTAGPFAVTNPPAAVTWDHAGGTGTATVTWNVAGTDAPPVSCANVDIDIHTGGDYTNSTAVLATGVPNSGSATVNIPNVASTTARVRVRCSNNIFFALNPGYFSITGDDLIFADGFEFGVVPTDPPTVAKAFAPTSVATGTPSTLTITLANPNATAATLTGSLTDTFPAGLVVASTPNAATTCPSGLVSTTSGSVTLAAGASIPASGSCTVTVNVESATAGSYANTIAAGALQTDVGNNVAAANATLTVTGGAPQPAFFNNALTAASPTFNNPQGATGLQYYCAQQFTVDANGSYTIETTSPNTSGTPSNALDTFLRLYANAFDPNAPATNFVVLNDDFSGTLTVLPGPYAGTITTASTGFSGAQPGSRIVQALTTGTTYIVVNTSFRATNFVGTGTNGQAVGPYYTGISGPGSVNLVGSTCTSTPVVTWTVTPSVDGGNGTIDPSTPQTVNDGATTTFTLTPDSGYDIGPVGGTCGGTLTGNSFETDAVTADCTVEATFVSNAWTVTPSVASGVGSISPASPQTVNDGDTATFTLTPAMGYEVGTVDGTCGGTLTGNSFETDAVTADCTVEANFTALAFPTPYCTRGYSDDVEPITLVNIDGINNTSSATVNGTPANENFTAIIGQMAPGGVYPVRLEGNSAGNFANAYAVYIDWNQDGTFGAGEGYYIGTIVNSTGADGKFVVGNVTVPGDALLGLTRMRVAKQYTSAASPTLANVAACGTTGFGQAEDYTINVDPAAPIPPTLAKAFSPVYADAGTATTLTIALGSTNASAITLTADLVDTLPTGLLVATPANASTTCGGTLTAGAGTDSITLANGASIPPGGCTVTVDVTAAVGGIYVNTIAGGLQTTAGNAPAASATYQALDTGVPGIVSYGTGFESPFTVGTINLQQGWSARSSNVATTLPANGLQHFVQTSTASPTTANNALAISPTATAGTAPYATISANLRITRLTNGATWRFNPQDPAAGLVTTLIEFERAATRNIRVPTWAGGSGTFVNTGAQWPIDTYFNLKFIVERATNNIRLCMDGTQIYENLAGDGTTGGNNISNVAISQLAGTGQTAGNTLMVDDLVIDYTTNGACGP